MADSIHIMLNGTAKVFPGVDGVLTISDVVTSLGLRADRVALEQNGEIVPRSAWPETAVRAGDQVELVHFVGGGTSVTDAV